MAQRHAERRFLGFLPLCAAQRIGADQLPEIVRSRFADREAWWTARACFLYLPLTFSLLLGTLFFPSGVGDHDLRHLSFAGTFHRSWLHYLAWVW